MTKNLFATVLTYPAPSSNYRGESEENRTILQKITKDGKDHTIISPESMRNALREMLAKEIDDGQINRKRRHDLDQLAVEFKEFPNADKFADDYLFGFMVADNKAISENKDLPSKRDSVLRMNMAVSVMPYRFNAVFHQSPLNADSPWKNSSTSALIHREIIHTAYQFPFALAGQDCQSQPEWTNALLKSIGQLTGVAGGHARSFYEMSPKSIIVRLTSGLIAGFDTYGFDEFGEFSELERINENDLPADEFWIGGELARNMSDAEKSDLEGVHFYDNPQTLLKEVSDEFLKTE
jgi:CRISPR-associated protein Cst2